MGQEGYDIIIIGGGNAALETAVDLFPYAKKIYLLIRGEDLKGDPVTQEKVKQSSQEEDLDETIRA